MSDLESHPGLEVAQSAWTYDTSGSFGAGIGYVAGESGQVRLRSPTKTIVNFRYVAAGGGLSAGVKLPFKIKVPESVVQALSRLASKKLSGSYSDLKFLSGGTYFA